jgi:thiamine biosynthesis lipoprotein
MRPSLSWLLASAAAVTPLAVPAVVHAEPFRFHDDHVLGTSLDVIAVAADEASALMAYTAARREIARLDKVLSAWRPDSELEGLNRSGKVKASADLHAVLTGCEDWRGKTGGAFDCRVGQPLALLRAGQTKAADCALKDARRPLHISADRTVQKPEGVRLAVDGMAKGYVIDKALAAARKASPGLKGLMIDIGGDLRCWGQAPQAAGWRVGVATDGQADNAAPTLALALDDRALAVSGRGDRDLALDGQASSHTLDPRTGRPVAHVRSAAVVARTAADADALATAFMVMKPEHALALADRMPGAEALITAADGAQHRSRGWSGLEQPMLIRASYAAHAATAAGPVAAPVAAKGLSLDMTYTVPKIDAEPYHAPYVVAWLTDANRQMVRTLLVLGVKPKWAPENFVWWRRYGRIAPQVLETVGKPTRLPGKYTLHWDGKDETGKPVAPGQYILHIESSREKGGHTYQTLDLALGGAGAKTLPAKDEMGAVEVKFGPA